jgi:hypothetical protein
MNLGKNRSTPYGRLCLALNAFADFLCRGGAAIHARRSELLDGKRFALSISIIVALQPHSQSGTKQGIKVYFQLRHPYDLISLASYDGTTMDTASPPNRTSHPTKSNIEAIAKMEHDSLGRRTLTERVSDVITKLVGNPGFLLAQMLLLTGWILVNLRIIPGVIPFDPFPFGALALIVSTEGL